MCKFNCNEVLRFILLLVFALNYLNAVQESMKKSVNVNPDLRYISSVESQKSVITVQRCSIENQKGAIAIDFVQQ